MEELIRSWNRAAPHFLTGTINRNKHGVVSVSLHRKMNKDKRKIVRDGARLVGYTAEISDEKILFSPLESRVRESPVGVPPGAKHRPGHRPR